MIKNALTLIGLLPFICQIGVAQEVYSPESLLNFEQRNVNILENNGQLKDTEGNPVDFVLFKIETPGVDFYLTETGVTYIFKEFEEEHHKEGEEREEEREVKWERIDLILNNASINRENIVKEFPSTQGHFNYFHEHCPDGIYGVKEYGKITIKDVYPNIDWVLYNTRSVGYKYDFILNPGANPDDIDLVYRSKNKPELSDAGELSIQTSIGTLTEKSPVSFLDGKKVDSRFELKSIVSTIYDGYDTRFTFVFDDEVKEQFSKGKNILVIDPELVWGTLYGGDGFDGTHSIDTDSENNIYATGYTGSLDFPLEDFGEFFQGTAAGSFDLFILKFDENGNLIWATFYGGEGLDVGEAVEVDVYDNLFVGGTAGIGFPTEDAGTFFQETLGGGGDGFLLKFDSDGTRLWATFYGGLNDEGVYGLDSDMEGDLFVTGTTGSSDFPLLDAGTFFQGTFGGGVNDGFILKFDNDGNRLWGTYYGGSELGVENCYAAATDQDGNVFVVGETRSEDFPLLDAGTFYDGMMDGIGAGFILKFDNEGNRLWGTYCDGNEWDRTYSVAVDIDDNLVVTGATNSTDFPLLDIGGYYDDVLDDMDAYIMKFENNGELIWSTYYGGTAGEFFNTQDNLAINPCDNSINLFFETGSEDIDTSPFCDGGFYEGDFDGFLMQFLTQFSSEGELMGATYVGGSSVDIRAAVACDTKGNTVLTGEWATFDIELGSGYDLFDNGTYFDSTLNGLDDIFFVKLMRNELIGELSIVEDSCGMGNGSIEVVFEGYSCTSNLKWSLGGDFVFFTDDTFLINSLSAGTYTLRVANNCDTLTFEDIVIPSVGGDWDFSLGDDSTFCSAGFVLDPGIDAATYEWQDGSPDPTYTVDDGGLYWLIAISEDGCVATDSVTFVLGGLDVDILMNEPTCYGFSDASIVLEVGGATGEITFEIDNADGEKVNAENSNAANELNSGWYYISVEAGEDCFFIDSIFIDQPAPITADISVTNPLCHGDSTGFAVVDGVYAYQGDLENVSYIWAPNFFGSGGVGVDSAYGMPSGEYVLTLTDEMGCAHTVDFIVEEPPALEFTEFGSDPAFCRMFSYQNGNGVVYAAAVGGTPDYTYLWENTETMETTDNSTWGGLNPGNYKVTVTDDNGCVLIDYIQLDSVNPIAAFDVLSDQLDDNLEGTELVEVTFVNQSEYFSNPNDLVADTIFQWNLDYDYADWEISHNYFYQPDTVYAGEKVYEVCLIAYNKNGCRDTLCKEIIVHIQPEFVAPNIFTPGSDNSNDLFTFEFRTEGIAEFHCVIVNRWGVKVAELNDITEGWDGTDQNGDLCANGVYFYVYEAVSTNKTAFNGQGTVQLISEE